jgi:hypothetical protein
VRRDVMRFNLIDNSIARLNIQAGFNAFCESVLRRTAAK